MTKRINTDPDVRDLTEVLKGEQQNISGICEKAYIYLPIFLKSL